MSDTPTVSVSTIQGTKARYCTCTVAEDCNLRVQSRSRSRSRTLQKLGDQLEFAGPLTATVPAALAGSQVRTVLTKGNYCEMPIRNWMPS
eukprot:750046-Hanusia_phi.AAC.1